MKKIIFIILLFASFSASAQTIWNPISGSWEYKQDLKVDNIFIPPAYTTAGRPAPTVPYQLINNTDSGKLQISTGLAWVTVGGGSGFIPSGTSVQLIAGNGTYINPVPGTVGLGNVVNVDQTNATNILSGTLNAARLPTSGVTATTYGDATHVAQVQVDVSGRVISASSILITGIGGGSGTDSASIHGFTSINDTTFVGYRLNGTSDTVRFYFSGGGGGGGGSFVNPMTITNDMIFQNGGTYTRLAAPGHDGMVLKRISGTLGWGDTTAIPSLTNYLNKTNGTDTAKWHTMGFYDGRYLTPAGTQTVTNKTIVAGSNTITGITNANLSGTAGITNANLANSSIIIDGAGIPLGGSVTIDPALTSTYIGVGNGSNKLSGSANLTYTLTGTRSQLQFGGSTGQTNIFDATYNSLYNIGGTYGGTFLGYGNSGIGYQGLFSLTTGSYNTSNGSGALSSLQASSNNTSAGYQSGGFIQSATSYNNIFNGYKAGALTADPTINSIFIGYKADKKTVTGGLSNTYIIADSVQTDSNNVAFFGRNDQRIILGNGGGNTAAMNALHPMLSAIFFNTDSAAYCMYNGSAWVKWGGGSGGSCSGCYVASDTLTTLVTHKALVDSLNKTTYVVQDNYTSGDSIYGGGHLIMDRHSSGSNLYNWYFDSTKIFATGTAFTTTQSLDTAGRKLLVFNTSTKQFQTMYWQVPGATSSGYSASVAVNTANYTVPAGSLIYITLPDLTGQANRNLVLPSAVSGVHTVIKNNNTSASGFTWSFTVRTVKDFGNNTITTVPNLAVVQLFDDGTNENIGN